MKSAPIARCVAADPRHRRVRCGTPCRLRPDGGGKGIKIPQSIAVGFWGNELILEFPTKSMRPGFRAAAIVDFGAKQSHGFVGLRHTMNSRGRVRGCVLPHFLAL